MSVEILHCSPLIPAVDNCFSVRLNKFCSNIIFIEGVLRICKNRKYKVSAAGRHTKA
jgi:hypothetical protein